MSVSGVISHHSNLKVLGDSKKTFSSMQQYAERYNKHHSDARIRTIKDETGRAGLEGVLRIHWGLTRPIQFQQDNRRLRSRVGHMQRSPRSSRKGSVRESYRPGARNGGPDSEAAEDELQQQAAELKLWSDQFAKGIKSPALLAPDGRPQTVMEQPGMEGETTPGLGGVRMRKAQRSKTLAGGRIARCASINGHYYKAETSLNFLPPFGSDTPVVVTDSDTPSTIIHSLLSKFKIENSPEDFSLYIDRKDGAMHTMKETDKPLQELLLVNPSEGPKIFLMEKMSASSQSTSLSVTLCDANANNTSPAKEGNSDTNGTMVGTDERRLPAPATSYQPAVSDFMNLPQPMLEAFVRKYDMEEKESADKIGQRYESLKACIMDMMENFVTHL